MSECVRVEDKTQDSVRVRMKMRRVDAEGPTFSFPRERVGGVLYPSSLDACFFFFGFMVTFFKCDFSQKK